jgi:hypothetical protein
MPMFKRGLSALVVVLLALSADSEAGWRCRQAQYCYTPCAYDGCVITSCAPCVSCCYDPNAIACPLGYTCMCYYNSSFVACSDAPTCDAGTMCCVLTTSPGNPTITVTEHPDPPSPPSYDRASASQDPSTNPYALYAFKGDDSTNPPTLRHTRDGEPVELLGPKGYKGKKFKRN